MGFFEAAMLVCFGLAWPISIIRSWRSRSTGGKSVVFSIVILIGYVMGILNKVLYQRGSETFWVFYLYVLNFLMVGTDALLWVRNCRYEKQAEKEGPSGE
jgi:hypothetical protein